MFLQRVVYRFVNVIAYIIADNENLLSKYIPICLKIQIHI